MAASINKQNKISISIPIFLSLLLMGSIVGIIGNSILLGSSSENEPIRIFKIVVAAIFTLVLLLAVIFSSIEIAEPDGYKAKIFTSKTDKWLQSTYNNLESWEFLLVLSNFILLPIGLATSLISDGSPYFVTSAITMVIIYFSYSQRIGTRKSVKAILPGQESISLTDLSKLISKESKIVRKAIVHLISFENYPASYDYSSGIITYLGSSIISNNLDSRVIEPELTITRKKQVKPKEVTQKKKPCPYCGEIPIVNHAVFCSDCGASLVAAK
ncbi:MAG: hypothetical protein HeimC2_00110 [Candidatus Heimdallarchaeota archaeon LC_2]|nr:MAG: hypothetical protein HeimC2_00110 [Candidatus Heimdallarchaeota archaeon LC_2]